MKFLVGADAVFSTNFLIYRLLLSARRRSLEKALREGR